MTSPLFLGSSFTIKSLFLISGRLDELVWGKQGIISEA
jgi:hypothetical protein